MEENLKQSMYKCITEYIYMYNWITLLSTSNWHNIVNQLCCCYCSTAKLCPTLCNPMGCSRPGSSVLTCLLAFAHIHVHWVVIHWVKGAWVTQWSYGPCCAGPPKTERSYWRVLTKHGPLEKEMATPSTILAHGWYEEVKKKKSQLYFN